MELEINLKPALSPEQLDARILRDFDKFKGKIAKNSLGDLLPAKLISSSSTWHTCPKKNASTKSLRLSVDGSQKFCRACR